MALLTPGTAALPIVIKDEPVAPSGPPPRMKKMREVVHTPQRSPRFPRRSPCLLSLACSAAEDYGSLLSATAFGCWMGMIPTMRLGTRHIWIVSIVRHLNTCILHYALVLRGLLEVVKMKKAIKLQESKNSYNSFATKDCCVAQSIIDDVYPTYGSET